MGSSRVQAAAAALAILAIGSVSQANGTPSSKGIVDPHIVSGSYTLISRIPYQVTLEDETGSVFCGGVIVSKKHVLTAGHCMVGKTNDTTKIRAGSAIRIPWLNFLFSVVHDVESITIHPKFTNELDYDVAVVTMKNEFVFTRWVQAIAVPNESEDDFVDYTQSYTVSGWGRTKAEDSRKPFWLLSIEIWPMDREECFLSSKKAVTPRNICGTTKGRETPCYGDSGGPMTHRKKLVGLVSWGQKCDASYPTVYTNLMNTEIRQFIRIYTGI